MMEGGSMTDNESDPVTASTDEFPDVRELIAAGNTIGAIKRLQQHTDCDLADARRYVDARAAGGPAPATPQPEGGPEGWMRWVLWLAAPSFIAMGIVPLATGHVLDGISTLAVAALFARMLGARFGLRGRAVHVLTWLLIAVYLVTTHFRRTGGG
jgi:hypothetical protein